MPQIAKVPPSKFTTNAERSSLDREYRDSSGNIPITGSHNTPTEAKASPTTHRVAQTYKGLNRHNNHTIDVIDMSMDKSQYYGFLAHCQTCAWEGRYNTLADATANAKMHVGQ